MNARRLPQMLGHIRSLRLEHTATLLERALDFVSATHRVQMVLDLFTRHLNATTGRTRRDELLTDAVVGFFVLFLEQNFTELTNQVALRMLTLLLMQKVLLEGSFPVAAGLPVITEHGYVVDLLLELVVDGNVLALDRLVACGTCGAFLQYVGQTCGADSVAAVLELNGIFEIGLAVFALIAGVEFAYSPANLFRLDRGLGAF